MNKNNIKKFAIIAVLIVILCFFALFFCMVLSSCKSPQKTVSASKLDQTTNISNDILSSDEKQSKELTDRMMKLLINEQLNVDIKNVKYDTEKPADSITGKHPVSEITDIKINRKTNVNKSDSTHNETDSVSAIKAKDNSKEIIKTKSETKETKQTGLSALQRNLIAAGIISIIGFIIFIIIKIKK